MTVHWSDLTARQRDALVAVVAEGPAECREIIDRMNEWPGASMTTPAISGHLKSLVECGAVDASAGVHGHTYEATRLGRRLVEDHFDVVAHVLAEDQEVASRA